MRSVRVMAATAALLVSTALSAFASPVSTAPVAIHLAGRPKVGQYVRLQFSFPNDPGGSGLNTGSLKFIDYTNPKLDSTAPGIITNLGSSGAAQYGGLFTQTTHGLTFQFPASMANTRGQFEFTWTYPREPVTEKSGIFTVRAGSTAALQPYGSLAPTWTIIAVHGQTKAGHTITLSSTVPEYSLSESQPTGSSLVGTIWFADSNPGLDTSTLFDVSEGGGFDLDATPITYHLASATAGTVGQFQIIYPQFGGGLFVEQSRPFQIAR